MASLSGSYGFTEDFLGDIIPGSTKNSIPKPAEPPPPIQAGEEGIRRGAMIREGTKNRQLTSAYLNRMRPTVDDTTLGGYRNTLA